MPETPPVTPAPVAPTASTLLPTPGPRQKALLAEQRALLTHRRAVLQRQWDRLTTERNVVESRMADLGADMVALEQLEKKLA